MARARTPEGVEKRRAYSRDWHRKNRAAGTEKGSAWYEKNREKLLARQRAWKKAHPEEQRARKRKEVFGLSHEQYLTMHGKQEGRCAICHESPSGGAKHSVLHVDHDHTTSKVRGLLCGYCNRALGNMRDEPARLRAAAAYLEA